MAWKTSRTLGALLVGLMSLIWRATGQESMYSADSLMRAFENSSTISPKGAQITFHDVVMESDDGKLTFKSSRNKRVICKLVSSIGNQNKPPSVGSAITVTGKVRGRGLLGNVTLDDCSMVPIAESQDPANLQQDTASVPVDAVSEESVEAASPPAQPEELRNDFPPTRNPRPSRPGTRRSREQPVPSSKLDQQDQTTKSGADSPRDVPYRLYALLLVCGALGYSILSKLLISTVRALPSPRYPESVNTEEVRKAALEALLLKSSKKK
jgi:hypothetical protein